MEDFVPRTFLELVQEAHDLMGESPIPTSLEDLQRGTVAHALASNIQRGYDRVINKRKWWWLDGEQRIRLEAPEDTGTITLTAGSPDFTGTGTAFTSDHVGRLLRVQGDRHYYVIKSIASATAGTLEQTAVETQTDVSFHIYKHQYVLPMDYDRMIEVVNPRIGDRPVQGMDTWEFFRRVSGRGGLALEGIPFLYTVYEFDEQTRQRYLMPWPQAREAHDLIVYYKKQRVPLINDTDEPLIPEKHLQVLVYWALYQYYTHTQPDARAAVAKQDYDTELNTMLEDQDTHERGDFRLTPSSGYKRRAIRRLLAHPQKLAHREVQDRY